MYLISFETIVVIHVFLASSPLLPRLCGGSAAFPDELQPPVNQYNGRTCSSMCIHMHVHENSGSNPRWLQLAPHWPNNWKPDTWPVHRLNPIACKAPHKSMLSLQLMPQLDSTDLSWLTDNHSTNQMSTLRGRVCARWLCSLSPLNVHF